MLQPIQNIFNTVQPNKTGLQATMLSSSEAFLTQTLIQCGWPVTTATSPQPTESAPFPSLSTLLALHSSIPPTPWLFPPPVWWSPPNHLLAPPSFTPHTLLLASLSLFPSKEHGPKAPINPSCISASQPFPLLFSHLDEGSEKLSFQNSTQLVREKWNHVIHRWVLHKMGLVALCMCSSLPTATLLPHGARSTFLTKIYGYFEFLTVFFHRSDLLFLWS